MKKYEKQFRSLKNLIGNTPLLEIKFRYRSEKRSLYAKAEWYNLTGSIKDRVAYYILEHAYAQGIIQKGDRIVEATSGNTGISFAALGAYLGHPVTIFMPDWMSPERINLMRSYGAQVELVSKEEGGFKGAIALAEKLGEQTHVFLPRQFSNEDNTNAHYVLTGFEMQQQFEKLGLIVDGIVAGVGTGGTIMGLARRFKEANPYCQAFPLEPLNSPTLSTGYKVGNHRIQGISDEFIPDLLKLNTLDSIISVDDGDSVMMARLLCEKLGLGVGISSGANFIGGIIAQEKIGKGSIIVTTFADDNKKYLSTDYSIGCEVGENSYTKDVELLGVDVYHV